MASRDLQNLNIQYLKGIGENRAKSFKRLGINTAYALLRYYPRDFRDYSNTLPLVNLSDGEVAAVKCKVLTDVSEHFVRKNMTIYKFTASDDTGLLQVTVYNNRFIKSRIKKGESYIFYGKINGFGVNKSVSAPDIIDSDKAVITPIYPTTYGLYQSTIRKAVLEALKLEIIDPLPKSLKQKYNLCDLEFALKNIHYPENPQALQVAKQRLVFEELFLFRLGIMLFKRSNEIKIGKFLKYTKLDEFLNVLPFTLTDTQLGAINDCISDMLSGKSMNRLIEGDVGSGKTVVSAALMYLCAKSKMQCALMAPTEILAEQHYNTISGFLNPFGIKVKLLTGSAKKSEKTAIKQSLLTGETDVIIGTQALIQDDVEFNNLGLVITDEQHRFGVAQRSKLASKTVSPHTVVMSATPIPRTLGLIIYGDLDLSVINTLPKGRKPIKTYKVNSTMRGRFLEFIKKHVAAGRQAYIVCPLVEESDSGLLSATEYYEQLCEGELKDLRLGLLHGKQKPREKDEVMRNFSSGLIDVLVCTTVVEVGVDVPNATVMVIENAERFGLSQLHQLRGRVGRGEHESFCVLVSDSKSKSTIERLDIMCKTTDGFEIADEDLKLRGPGDFLGSRQHGLPQFKIADLECNLEELQLVGDAAKEILSGDHNLSKPENAPLKKGIFDMFEIAENGIS